MIFGQRATWDIRLRAKILAKIMGFLGPPGTGAAGHSDPDWGQTWT